MEGFYFKSINKIEIMRKIAIVIVSVLAFSSTYAQDQGIGLRFGDLNGVTYKKYGNAKDLEFGIGSAYYVDGRFDYNNYFLDDWYAKRNFSYSEIEFRDYRQSSAFILHARMLFHKKLDNIAGESVSGLNWYYGLGAQLRTRSLIYNYRYKTDPNANWTYASTGKITDIDLGGEGILGLEYTFADAPISLFLDINLFVEIADDPFAMWFQSGIGGRYRF